MSNRMKWDHLKKVGAIAVGSLLLLMVIGGSKLASNESRLAERDLQPVSYSVYPSNPDSVRKDLVGQASPAMTSKLADANTRFGFKLFSAITKNDPNKNVFVSPSSVAIALAMVYNGANGKTQQEMSRVLEIQGMSLQELNRANADLKALLQNPDPQVQLAIANSLWTQRGVSFKPDFIQRNEKFYQAKVTELDFANPQAVPTINQWVSQNTRGKIEAIVDRLSPSQLMVLINAIYFKGSWTRPFDTKQTTTEPFYLTSEAAKKHPMMTQRGEYYYYENNLFQAVQLPYGKTRKVNMVVLLPKQSVGLPKLQQNLTPENWMQWLNQLQRRQGSIKLPRFKVEYETELTGVLSRLGMIEAFGDRADFSGLSPVSAQIDEVKHKTFVEVNEEGTEAAAVTSIGIRATSVQPAQAPFNMIVNRPFFCAIVDDQTGSLLFMGAIVDPKQ